MKVQLSYDNDFFTGINANLLCEKNDYFVIGIENNYYRVVNDSLDPVLYPVSFFSIEDYQGVANWKTTFIDEDHMEIAPAEISIHRYFYNDLHEGNKENSMYFADIYFKYLKQLIGTNQLSEQIYFVYKQAKNNHPKIYMPYWQKQWIKSIFNVDKIVELRHVSEQNWINILNLKLINL